MVSGGSGRPRVPAGGSGQLKGKECWGTRRRGRPGPAQNGEERTSRLAITRARTSRYA
jgi:hypothetical protein